MILKNTIADEF